MNQPFESRSYPPFRPILDGCVGRDPRLSRMLEDLYPRALYAVAAYTYRSLICERIDKGLSDLFDRFAIDEVEHFRLLGQLILALGGNPMIRVQLRVDPVNPAYEETASKDRAVAYMLSESKQEGKSRIDRYQTLMGGAQDRVVRSLLSHILSDEEHRISQIVSAMP